LPTRRNIVLNNIRRGNGLLKYVVEGRMEGRRTKIRMEGRRTKKEWKKIELKEEWKEGELK